MTNGAIYFKYGVLLIIAVLLFLAFRGCSGCGDPKPSKTDTVTVETVKQIEVIKHDTSYVPKPYKVTEYKTDTLETTEVRFDTLKTIKDYLATRYYRDSISFKDSAGYAIIQDTVSRNKIQGRGVTASINKTTVTNTITIREEPNKKAILYLGGSVGGNKHQILQVASASAGIKGKNDKYFGYRYTLMRSGTDIHEIEFKLPIKFGKK